MIRYGTAVLLHEENARGVFDTPRVERREVYVSVRSVWMNEAYTALAHGFTPDMTLVISNPEDYDYERRLEFEGLEYDVIRTYINASEGVELTCQRRTTHDAQ